MQRKEKGFLYLDTHAGRGRYDLRAAETGDSLARVPEWPDGLGRLLVRTDAPAGVRAYVEAVREHDRREGNLEDRPRFYPGSPLLARRWTRPQDRLELCELHPDEVAALRGACGRLPGVGVHALDGYAAVRAFLPPPTRRAVILIDPPFEAADEWTRIHEAVAEALSRLAGATLAIWFPITARAAVEELRVDLPRRLAAPCWVAEIVVAPEASALKMRGCGLLVINPPWQLANDVAPEIAWLANALAREEGASGSLTWLVPER
jgi:23S rRNA (adenine2030-N6)-methyltransferase